MLVYNASNLDKNNIQYSPESLCSNALTIPQPVTAINMNTGIAFTNPTLRLKYPAYFVETAPDVISGLTTSTVSLTIWLLAITSIPAPITNNSTKNIPNAPIDI